MDWLNFWLDFTAKILVPISIFTLTAYFTKIEKKKQEGEKEAEKDRFKEQAFQDYIDRISQLLIDKEYRLEIKQESEEDNPIKDVARSLTTTILRRLGGDQKRQDRVIHFLRDTNLLFYLLQKCKLDKANLSGANLYEANLYEANLYEANLSGAFLYKANLSGAKLLKANLKGANLREADLLKANLSSAKLPRVNLSKANLTKADLPGVNLFEANLAETNLSGAYLGRANLSRALLFKTNLEGANLSEAYLGEANELTNQQIKSALYWEEAIYTKAEWNQKQSRWIAENEQANKDKIEEIGRDSTINS